MTSHALSLPVTAGATGTRRLKVRLWYALLALAAAFGLAAWI